MMSFMNIFLLIVWIFFKIMHTKVCSCVSSTYVLFSSIKTSAMVILLTLYLNQVHQLVDSKGNVQVLLLSLKHNDQRMCVSKAWTLSVCSRWFDKSVQFITYENGYCGVCGEHSSIDATVSRGTRVWGYVEEFVSQHVLQCYRFTMKIKPICNLKMKKKFPKNSF